MDLLSYFRTAFDLLLVLGGFSLIIVAHELGHFAAARWAGIRVLAFAVGFGPAMVSFRKGLGWRRGSSEAEYNRLIGKARASSDPQAAEMSPTEYRLNVLPFGGYVKMLGQDDAAPTAISDAPDGYQRCPVWKRMIVISAGVVMNMIVAAVLFVIVFMIGLRTEAPMVGDVLPGSPAAAAGLLPGDVVLSIDGSTPSSFTDVMVASAMARKGRPIDITVQRRGRPEPLRVTVEPKEDPETRMLQVGIAPASSTTVITPKGAENLKQFRRIAEDSELPGLEPGMVLKSIDGSPAHSLADLSLAARNSNGRPITVAFEDARGGAPLTFTLNPSPQSQTASVPPPDRGEQETIVPHVLGLMPVMQVSYVTDAGERAGLRAGDLLERIGGLEWPNPLDGQREIRANARKTLAISVLRPAGSSYERIDLPAVPVGRDKTIGFGYRLGSRAPARVASWPEGSQPEGTPRLIRGTRIVAVNGHPVSDMGDIQRQVRRMIAAGGGQDAPVMLDVELPPTAMSPEPATEKIEWRLTPEQYRAVADAGWESPIPGALFEPEYILDKAESPIGALRKGLERTRTVMLSTYITFARLFQGSIKVQHLKGPVGIAHVGTLLAQKGFVWLLFFLGLISVNLAVVNFLPIPIADGGQFVFLLYEAIFRRPASVAVQNFAAITGLVLIVGLFVVVTFNDVVNLFASGR
ncbi:MAG: site-2 protease family protein [Phycisphaeraceae bacterium]|nr:site-2 protease family protein [Phycisphaeraceae bacterium]